MPSADDLSEAAQTAYQAFVDMSNSKTVHFNYLKAIDDQYSKGGVPSIKENLELQRLLNDHDQNVLAFKTAMAAVTDSDEQKVLLQLMS